MSRKVFVTGATGYVGSRLARELLGRGHAVKALARPASASRLPPGCEVVLGDALDAATYAQDVPPADTFVHLVGVPHPNPSKARAFRDVDLTSALAAVDAAAGARVAHFVYVSVAQPAPVMRAFQAARREAEDAIRASGLDATIVRPWYVLGPGHWWPLALVPLYALAARVPAWRASAARLGLVTIAQMVRTLAEAVDHSADGLRILDVAAIRAARLGGPGGSDRLQGPASAPRPGFHS
jgi:uncharacterized protein YbjT (DUF2867 family)